MCVQRTRVMSNCRLLSCQSTNPHVLFVVYQILLQDSLTNPRKCFTHPLWSTLVVLLLENLWQVEDAWNPPHISRSDHHSSMPVEYRIRLPVTRLLYEYVRGQSLPQSALRIFDQEAIQRIFDMIDSTTLETDDRLNTALVLFIVSATLRRLSGKAMGCLILLKGCTQ